MNHGDAERLTWIVTERAGALVLYARQWLDAASAEDAIQDAYAALLSQREPPRQPLAWMYRAVRNAAIDAARSHRRRSRREQLAAGARAEWFAPDPGALLDGQMAEQSLRKLKPDDREIVVLRIWGDLAFAEIAEIVGLGVSTVHDRYKAALNQLRTALEHPCSTKTNWPPD